MRKIRKNPAKNGYICYRKKDGTIVGKFHVVIPKILIDQIHLEAEQKGYGTRNKWVVDHFLEYFKMNPGKEGLSAATAESFMVAPSRREDSSQ